MTWAALLWFPPLMLGVAAVLGAAGSDEGWRGMWRDIVKMFLTLSFGVIAVGVAVHLVAALFSG